MESKLNLATEEARLFDADAANYKRVAEAQRIRLADQRPVVATSARLGLPHQVRLDYGELVACLHEPNDPAEAPRTHAEYARTRCYSSDVSNAAKFGTALKGIADEVRPARCASGMRLTIGFGCDAIATRRFDTSKIRIVWRNASTPKFNNAEFEER